MKIPPHPVWALMEIIIILYAVAVMIIIGSWWDSGKDGVPLSFRQSAFIWPEELILEACECLCVLYS